MADLTDMPEAAIDVSRMPRIPYLSYDEADEPTRELWDEMGRPEAYGEHQVDNQHALFRTLIHHPELFEVNTPFVLYVKDSTNLPVRHRELAIMRSAWLCGCDDQWVNHTTIGMDGGLTEEEVERIAAGPDAPGWADDDDAVLRAVDELHRWCRIGDETWSALARLYDSRQLIEFLLLVGNYRMLSYVQNSVGIRPVTGTTPSVPGNRFLFPDSG
ncbi:MAG: carboxymuconolactone decarboxylase family protein [Actinomycetota bacterium]|nr:carboxymuconolactone decarboxylase family protein [Actinomycetota bacterium]